MTDQTPNQQRASYARDALKFSEHYSGYNENDSCAVQDLLSDLMHLCNGKEWDFGEILRVATNNFNAEVMDEEAEGMAA